MEIKKFAEQIIEGYLAKLTLESELEDYFWGNRKFEIGDPLIVEIFSDYYDNSIEIDIAFIEYPEEFVKIKITDEFIKEILESGCSRFWINFFDVEDGKKIAEFYSGNKSFKLIQ